VSAAEPAAGAPDQPGVGAIAELYLGNLLYALERCAMSFDAEGKAEEAAFYRGLATLLADARGRSRPDGR
jgi:hypothetical protein